MTEDYNSMPTAELEGILADINKEYEEYKPILAEILSNMNELSERYNNISQIINIRNGRGKKQ